MKLTKKDVKKLKRTLTTGILNQINSEAGYLVILGTAEYNLVERINCNTKWVDSTWGAGICAYAFGVDLTRVDFASEEAKRLVRGMFPTQAAFIIWAWYN